MAILKSNFLFGGISGRVGNVVFRQKNGKTVVCQRPARGKKKPSNKQLAHQQRFKEAAEFAKEELQDPERRAYYEWMARKLKLSSAYTTAVKFFLGGHPDEDKTDYDSDMEIILHDN